MISYCELIVIVVYGIRLISKCSNADDVECDFGHCRMCQKDQEASESKEMSTPVID